MRAPIELPEEDEGDDLDDDDRERLHAALAASEDDVREGRLVPADQVLSRLRPARR